MRLPGGWGVSLTFRELSKILSRNLSVAEIMLLIRISRANFQLEILTINVISGIVYFREIIWRDHETLVKQLQGTILTLLGFTVTIFIYPWLARWT